MAFSSIEIIDYRGIEHLKIPNLGQINIFTGKNNVGKSSCLEALALVGSGPFGFKDQFDEDLLKFILLRRTKDPMAWNYLIKENANKAMIITNKIIDNEVKVEGVIIGENFDNMEMEPSSQLLQTLKKKEDDFYETRRGGVVSTRLRRKSEQENLKQMYFYYQNGIETIAKLFEYGYSNNVVAIDARSGISAFSEGVVFIKGFENEEILHDMAAMTGNLHKTIKRLSQKIPDFEDLRKIGTTLYVFYKNKSKMPLSVMGDGFKAGILTTLYAQSLHHGILILEEPENYLHPGLMMHLVDELIIACKENDIQMFISSHSDELIKFCLEKTKGLDVRLIRMNNLDGNVMAESLTRDDALKQIQELGLDLRGI